MNKLGDGVDGANEISEHKNPVVLASRTPPPTGDITTGRNLIRIESKSVWVGMAHGFLQHIGRWPTHIPNNCTTQ